MNTPLPQPMNYQGQEGEDPTAPFWGSGNYVGPYWSNGKVQTSVEWGDKPALHELDALARQHDAAYAHFKDEKHREAADAIFAEEARKLKQKYGSKLADDPKFAAAMVEYGNHTARQLKKLATSGIFVPGLAPLAVFKYGYDHMKEFTARIKGTHLKNELFDVRDFYRRDTTPHQIKVGELGYSKSLWKKPVIDTKGKVSGASDVARPSTSGLPEKPGPSSQLVKDAELNSSRIQNSEQLIESQARRFRNYKALHDAALASSKVAPQGYRKPRLNLNAAKPKKKSKRNAVRPL